MSRLLSTANPRLTWLILGLVAVHLLGAALFLVDPRIPFALLVVLVGVAVALERPVWGVALLIAGRLTSTGANAWVRVGKINIDLFEPALLLAVGALVVHAITRRQPIVREAPWRLPVLMFMGFQVLSLAWSTAKGEGLQEVVATGVLLATTLVILAYLRTWAQVRFALLAWLATSTMVGLAAMAGIMSPDEVAFEMAQGSRESGFGQHPNWFAMNLVFIVPTAFGLGWIEKKGWVRWLIWGAGGFVFLAQMTSGSRGGTWSVLLGLGVASLFHPGIRKMALRVGGVAAIVVAVILLGDIGGATRSFERIWTGSTAILGRSVRLSNWIVCLELFRDTWGLGIGGGGYAEQLARYDWWLYQSQYRYPHGIHWGLLAHYGVVGLTLAAWFLARLRRMTQELLQRTRGTDLQIIAWCMAATMIGYFAWSTVEFAYDDKPFWEFLGVYTALWAVVRRSEEGP